MKRIVAFSVAALLAFPVAAQEPETGPFVHKIAPNSCRVNYTRTDGLELSWIVSKPGGQVMLEVGKNGWTYVNGKDPNTKAATVTIDFEDVGQTTSATGGYFLDAPEGLWGFWADGTAATGSELLTYLEQATAVRIYQNGTYIGRFDMHQKGVAHALLIKCFKAG